MIIRRGTYGTDSWYEPDEYSEPKEYDDVTEEINLKLNKVIVTVDENGSWDYNTTAWAENTGVGYQCEEYQFDFREVHEIAEDFDEIVEPNIPGYPGKYQISCDATLVYNISNIYGDMVEAGGDGWEPEYEIQTDDVTVELDKTASVISNFVYSEVK